MAESLCVSVNISNVRHIRQFKQKINFLHSQIEYGEIYLVLGIRKWKRSSFAFKEQALSLSNLPLDVQPDLRKPKIEDNARFFVRDCRKTIIVNRILFEFLIRDSKLKNKKDMFYKA